MVYRRKLFASLAACFYALFAFAAQATSELNMRQGVTETSVEAYELHMLVVWVMSVIALIVFGAMFYAIIFHRKSKNPTPATFSHSTKMEIIWTTIPIIILVALTVPAVNLLLKMEADKQDSDLSILVTGHQWKWQYKYLDHDIEFFSNLKTPQLRENFSLEEATNNPNYLLEVDNQLIIPANKKVRFLITAGDVIHSWWVPDLAVKKDAIPGFINETWTKTDKPGIYRGQCAELCGKWHGFMPIVVKVVEQNEFDSWVETKTQERIAAEKLAAEQAAQSWELDKLMELGEKVYLEKCALCHKADGTGMPPAFPALKGSEMAIKSDQIDAHIEMVVNGKTGTAMQAFGAQLTDAELAAVITYERNAWGNNTGEKIQPADIQAFKAGK